MICYTEVPFKAGLTVLSVQFFSMTIIFTQPISNNYKNSQKAVYMMHGLRTVRNIQLSISSIKSTTKILQR